MLAFSNDYYGFIFRATQSVELFCAYKCSGTTGGKDGHFEYFLDKEQQEEFVELLGKVKLGRKAAREETLSSGAVTYYTLEFEDGKVLKVSPRRFFMVNDDYYYFLNYDKIWDEFLEL